MMKTANMTKLSNDLKSTTDQSNKGWDPLGDLKGFIIIIVIVVLAVIFLPLQVATLSNFSWLQRQTCAKASVYNQICCETSNSNTLLVVAHNFAALGFAKKVISAVISD